MFIPTTESTKLFLLVVVVVVATYALYAIAVGPREATVSHVTYTFCRDNPVVAFALGVVAGHILWQL